MSPRVKELGRYFYHLSPPDRKNKLNKSYLNIILSVVLAISFLRLVLRLYINLMGIIGLRMGDKLENV